MIFEQHHMTPIHKHTRSQTARKQFRQQHFLQEVKTAAGKSSEACVWLRKDPEAPDWGSRSLTKRPVAEIQSSYCTVHNTHQCRAAVCSQVVCSEPADRQQSFCLIGAELTQPHINAPLPACSKYFSTFLFTLWISGFTLYWRWSCSTAGRGEGLSLRFDDACTGGSINKHSDFFLQNP